MSTFPVEAEHEILWMYVSANSCDFMGSVKAVENIEADLAPLIKDREERARRSVTLADLSTELLTTLSSNVRHNVANAVAQAVALGRLDGTNPAALAAAIRAGTPEEFEAACRTEPTLEERVRELVERWDDEGIGCPCGHLLEHHNANGCYVRISYEPEVVVCDCALTDDREEADLAVAELRVVLDHTDEEPR